MKYKLRPQIKILLVTLAKILLITLGIILIGMLMIHLIKDYSERMNKWYNECDEYYGYRANYYQCRLYHIRNN